VKIPENKCTGGVTKGPRKIHCSGFGVIKSLFDTTFIIILFFGFLACIVAFPLLEKYVSSLPIPDPKTLIAYWNQLVDSVMGSSSASSLPQGGPAGYTSNLDNAPAGLIGVDSDEEEDDLEDSKKLAGFDDDDDEDVDAVDGGSAELIELGGTEGSTRPKVAAQIPKLSGPS